MEHPCKGCHYYRGVNPGAKCCNYLLMTGKVRPCPPGKKCTVKILRKKGVTS